MLRAACGGRLSSCVLSAHSTGTICACVDRYQWDMQPTVLRVAKSMRERGFRVWVDTEMMSGSTLDAMAAAVEGAHCVLICITERYKVRTPSPALRIERPACPCGGSGGERALRADLRHGALQGERELPARGHV